MGGKSQSVRCHFTILCDVLYLGSLVKLCGVDRESHGLEITLVGGSLNESCFGSWHLSAVCGAGHRADGRCLLYLPSADLPSDDVPSDDVPSDDVRSDDLRPGDLRPGDLRPGDLRPGDLRPGDLRAGDLRAADLPSEYVPSADLPSTDLPSEYLLSSGGLLRGRH